MDRNRSALFCGPGAPFGHSSVKPTVFFPVTVDPIALRSSLEKTDDSANNVIFESSRYPAVAGPGNEEQTPPSHRDDRKCWALALNCDFPQAAIDRPGPVGLC